MRGVGGVRKSIHQSWLAKELGLGSSGRDFAGRGLHFKSGQWHFHQNNAPAPNYILVTDYMSKMGIKTVPQPPNSPDLAPWDFRLFLKLRLSLWDNWGDERGCDEGHWPAHTRGHPWGLPEVAVTVQQVHCSRRRLLRRGPEFHGCTLNKSSHTKKVCKLI